MIESNDSLTGKTPAQPNLTYAGLGISVASLTWLGILAVAAVWLPRSPMPLRFLRAVAATTIFLCRRRIFGLLTDSYLRTFCIYTASTLGIQCFFAVAKSLSRDESTPPATLPAAPLPPLIFPCHTTHTRFFPSQHSFTYSYLLVGIPIGWQHSAGLLSCDPLPNAREKAWFSVHAEDYLARGGHQGGLRAKLDDFLGQHDVKPAVYPHAYLVTAPRFLGWSFNPVSFWYLYNQDMVLRAMILEVNNTFDERRMYLLQPPLSSEDRRFRERWHKDFHVSPFNDRLGDYSFLGADPFGGQTHGLSMPQGPTIDNTITLLSPGPDPKPKLVGRVSSTSASLDPFDLSLNQKAVFMAKWCWTGLFTNLRVLREARVLWMKKKLQLFYRPEVNTGSIGRAESSEEVAFEQGFKKWLDLVAVTWKLRIGYNSAAGPARGRKVIIDGGRGSSDHLSYNEHTDFDLEILTPEWYAELVRAKRIKDVFDKRCFAAATGEGMATTSELGRTILTEVLDTHPGPDGKSRTSAGCSAVMIDCLRDGASFFATFLAVVRTALVGVPLSSSVEHLTYSDLLKSVTALDQSEISSATMRVLLADRLALGSLGLFALYRRVLWGLLVFGAARELSKVVML